MSAWLAPAKVNLTLMVGARSASGLHPVRSLIQTIDWCDRLTVVEGEEDRLEIEGADLLDGGDNLVWKAIAALEKEAGVRRPPLRITLQKRLPIGAGLGGGSADAAAALTAVGDMLGVSPPRLRNAAAPIGSDVPAALLGGTVWAEGFGEEVTRLPGLSGFGVAVLVPTFPLLTADVYRMWDDMGEPRGREFPSRFLPPSLRRSTPIRNDLTPAALRLRPDLGDLMEAVAGQWERPVAMSGSGSSIFSFFVDVEEAAGAAREVKGLASVAVGADLFPHGPVRDEAVT
ncbi:MAG: 4-(cytidine 5'-diphospho)-2-C-methyl-D-erythritol kinase [bacterium]|nr:4-(cytidine 5'-diphospho)-2-C-methyl-D-erythritol kinase [bacterium]